MLKVSSVDKNCSNLGAGFGAEVVGGRGGRGLRPGRGRSGGMEVEGGERDYCTLVVGYTCLTSSCLRRASGGDRDLRMWRKRETIPNATLSPPE